MSKPDTNNITNINYNDTMNKSSVNVIEKESKSNYIGKLNKEENSEITSNNGQSNKDNNKYTIKKILFIFFLVLIIAGLILIIGYFAFDWFKKKKELVIERKIQENNVSRYLETKNATNCYNYDGINDTQKIQNNTIITDFIVALNKKTKIHDLRDIDYLYENFLLIINITQFNETDSLYLGGINIYDESKTIQDLIILNNNLFPNNTNNLNSNETNNNNNILTNENQYNIPFCKFYFYENGTLENIYFPQNMNEFYKSAIEDLIEKVTPKLSKSLYKNETNKRRLNNGEEVVYLNYEQIIKNGVLNKTLIYEDKIEKTIDKSKDEYKFENNELNSKIIRTYNPSGDMTTLEMKGEALFISSQLKQNNNSNIVEKHLRTIEEKNGNKSETNESYNNLGLNEFKMNVSSNMVLIKTSFEPTTLENLNKLSNFYHEKGNETEEKTGNESLIETNDTNLINNESDINSTNQLRNLANKDLNFYSSYYSRQNILNIKFLGLNVGLNQHLYINNKNGLRQNMLI